MEKISLRPVAEEQLRAAHASAAGRAAVTAFSGGGRNLRQTVIALRAAEEPQEHESPGEATLLILTGRVRVTSGDKTVEATNGDMVRLPDSRHGLEVVEDSVLLLSVVTV